MEKGREKGYVVWMLGEISQVFSERNFRVYSIGNITSWITFFVQMVAISWMTWQLTKSTTWLATIALLDILPNAFLLPIGGALADRVDRLKIVGVTAALGFLQSTALAYFSYFNQLTIVKLSLLVLIHGTIHSFSIPALYGMLPRLISRSRLPTAIAVGAAYTQFAFFVGPALAGWLINSLGLSVAFAANAFGYLVYLLAMSRLRTPPDFRPPLATTKSMREDLVGGVQYIVGSRGISTLLLLVLMDSAISNAVYQMLPALAENAFGGNVNTLSSLLVSAGLGATLSAFLLARGGVKAATPTRIIWASLAFIISVIVLVSVRRIGLALSAMVIYGIAGELRRTGTVALLQLAVEDTHRGRVMSTQFLLQRVAGAIGSCSIGVGAEHWGLRIPILIAACLGLFCWAFAFRQRSTLDAAFRKDR